MRTWTVALFFFGFLNFLKIKRGTSLVVQWLGVYLPAQGIWVLSLPSPRKIPHAVEQRSPCAITPEPACCNYWSQCSLEPMLCNERSHREEKPLHHKEEQPPLSREKARVQQQRPSAAKNKRKIIKFKNKNKMKRHHQGNKRSSNKADWNSVSYVQFYIILPASLWDTIIFPIFRRRNWSYFSHFQKEKLKLKLLHNFKVT